MNDAEVLSQLDQLLTEYEGMTQRAHHSDLSDLGEVALEAMAGRFQAALVRFTIEGSSYRQQSDRVSAKDAFLRLPILAGATRSLREDVAAGWLTTIQELIHADTFADFLDQAVELLDKGYKDAAAVLVGCVLESHLRQLCGKFKVSTKGADGKPVTADTMRTQLAKASAYNKLVSSTIAG